MAGNEDLNDIDVDTDVAGDIDQETAKPSLKEAWQNNPLLKIAAVVLVGAVLVGGYVTLMGGDEGAGVETRIGGVKRTDTVKIIPGQHTSDVEYTEAMKKQNEQMEREAEKRGESFMPIPIATAEQEGIASPEAVASQTKTDPLDEWRQKMEAKRIELEKKSIEEEEQAEKAPQPEVVPIVTPVRPQQPLAGAPGTKQDANASKALMAQMRTIISAQSPVRSTNLRVTNIPSSYVQMKQEQEELKKMMQEEVAAGAGSGAGDAASEKYKDNLIVPAGSIIYAQLLNDLNSDFPGPALAQVLSGPLAGGRALGSFRVQAEEYLTLTFNRIVKDGVVYNVNGVAIDQETTFSALQSDVDRHYWTRVIIPAAAKFLEGYAAAVAETGTETTTTAGGGVATAEPEPSAKEELYAGINAATADVTDILKEGADRPVTVKVFRGTTMGILFMDSITTASAGG